MTPKRQANFRLSAEAHRLLAALAEKLSISQTAIVELAIRRAANAEKITRLPKREEK